MEKTESAESVSLFYKVTPSKSGISDVKPGFFLSKKELIGKSLDFQKFMLGHQYPNGIDTIELAQETDPDFKEYIEKDLKEVEKELDKLENLKLHLLIAKNAKNAKNNRKI